MYQKDFILRMIEMLAELIAGILGMIKKGDYDKASQMLENAYNDLLKEDAIRFRDIPKGNLTNELLDNHNYTNGHLEILAELFYAEAELAYAKNDRNSSLEYYEKSIILLEYVINNSNVFSIQKQSKLAKIQNKMMELN